MTEQGSLLKWMTRRHERMVFTRRARRLTELLAELLPADAATFLDVGCGDGTIARGVQDSRPGLTAQGVDVLARPEVAIPMEVYDGRRLPFEDNSFDVVTVVDVLHHCDDPDAVLADIARVAARAVLVKDHIASGRTSRAILKFMDWVGNRGHGVRLVYNYWTDDHWQAAWQRHGLTVADERRQLKLYPWGCRWLWERGKHFVARLEFTEGPRS